MIRMWWKKCKRRKPNWEWWWVRWEKKNRERKGLNQCHTWTDETSETLFWLRLRQERGGHWGLGGTRDHGRQQKTLAQNQVSPAMFGWFFFSEGNTTPGKKYYYYMHILILPAHWFDLSVTASISRLLSITIICQKFHHHSNFKLYNSIFFLYSF